MFSSQIIFNNYGNDFCSMLKGSWVGFDWRLTTAKKQKINHKTQLQQSFTVTKEVKETYITTHTHTHSLQTKGMTAMAWTPQPVNMWSSYDGLTPTESSWTRQCEKVLSQSSELGRKLTLVVVMGAALYVNDFLEGHPPWQTSTLEVVTEQRSEQWTAETSAGKQSIFDVSIAKDGWVRG